MEHTILTNIIGYAAAVVGTALMLPQVIKSFRTKKVEDLSYLMVVLYLLNCLFWALYGMLIVAWPVIICNSIAFLISIGQLALKIKYN
jgi:MtN3 and saliva related transmembrane protein